MIELKISCQDADEARIYLNALQYHNLITDFYQAVRQAKKHGQANDILAQVEHYFTDFSNAMEHNLGPY